ncbi:MAG: NAD(P)-dependent oxidoreductase [Desulfobacterales bacterium]
MAANRILVTGATGFVGSNLCRRLVRDGSEVHAITRPQSDVAQIEDVKNNLTIHVHDGSTAGMLKIIKTCRPKIVYHLASLFLAQHESEDIEALIKSNITFGVQLVEAMTIRRIPFLINTGTAWQHYRNEKYNPVCLYAATKQAFEILLKFYTETSPLRVITLKLFDTYGPFDPRAKLFSFLNQCKKQKQPISMSPGEQRLDLVHIDDVVEAFLIAAHRLEAGEVKSHEAYAVSSKKAVRLREIVELYERLSGIKLNIRWGGRPYRPREVMVPWNSGKRLPEWSPKIELEEGIQLVAQLPDRS